jgi:ketosteroid isomerase-like protein
MSVDDAILAANQAFYAAFNAKDIVAMDAAWAANAPVTCIHPGWNVLEGHEAVVESWRRILGNPQQPKIVAGGASVRVFGHTAIVICREFVGGSPLAATNIFVREGGRWLLVHHQSSPVAQL